MESRCDAVIETGLSVSDPFGCRCLNSFTMLRFHFPLVKPDVRIYRIRISQEPSRVLSPRNLGFASPETN